MQNAPKERSAIFSTFINLPFVFKTFVFSIFEWPLKTGFTVGIQDLRQNMFSDAIVIVAGASSDLEFYKLFENKFTFTQSP